MLISRSFVGSSKRSTLGPSINTLRRWSLLLSPPDKFSIFVYWRFPSNKNHKVKEEKVQVNRVRERDSRPKFSFKEKKEYEEIDKIIENLENKISDIEKAMEENATSYGKLQELSEEKEKFENELLEKYERYEYLNNLAEKIEEYKNSKEN